MRRTLWSSEMRPMRCDSPPPEDTLAYLFYRHICVEGLDPREQCGIALEMAEKAKLTIFVTGNDRRYVLERIAKEVGAEKADVITLVKRYLGSGCPEKVYAAPSLLKATYYERGRNSKKVDLELTCDQIMLSLCGALYTKVGYIDDVGIYLLSPEPRLLTAGFGDLVSFYRAMRWDVSYNVKRLYLSAAAPKGYSSVVELAVQEGGNRATVLSMTNIYLYDLTSYSELRDALRSTASLLRDDAVKGIAELVASRLQLFFENREYIGGMEVHDPRWLYDALRELRAMATSEDERVRAYASRMFWGVSRLVKSI